MLQRLSVPAEFTLLPDDQVQIRMSTAQRARDGHILEPLGCVLDNYRNNPIQLWQHDPDEPIGTNADIVASADGITARTTFAPIGVSPTADRIRGLVKAGIVRGVSIGFEILDAVPIDPARPRGGLHVSRWELLESSFVSVPADTGAGVTARASADHENGEISGMDDDKARAFAAKRTRMIVATPGGNTAVRGLYDLAQLAYVLSELGWIHASAVWEAEIEADDSAVPAMLGEALQGLGATLIAMTAEEVNEMLAGKGLAGVPPLEDVGIEERAWVEAAAAPALRAWRTGHATMQLRAGKVLSQATKAKIDQTGEHLDLAATRTAEAAGHQAKAVEQGETLSDSHARAVTAHDKMATAIEDANGSAPEDVAGKLAKVQQHHRAIGKHLGSIGERAAAIGDAQADAGGAIAGAQRCLRSATRCVRGVQDANGDTDTQDIQTSEGIDDSGGETDRAFSFEARQRHATALQLAAL